jgi:penicillin-binding protein 2
MVQALQVSSDTYFYVLGREDDEKGVGAFQKWASDFSFGSLTGIDLPGEAAGNVPSEKWRNDLYNAAKKPDSPCGRKIVFDPARDCYEAFDRPWGPGDNMNFSVGQGDLLGTPLQLATAYAAIANGGEIVRPHLAMKVVDPLGVTEEEFTPAPRRTLDISETTRTTIMEGLRQAAMESPGTSFSTFGGYPIQIAGKTGTAETPKGDQAWYAAVAPFDDPEIVVIVTIEEGGFGNETAAPSTRDILDAYFRVNSSDIEEVSGEVAIQE